MDWNLSLKEYYTQCLSLRTIDTIGITKKLWLDGFMWINPQNTIDHDVLILRRKVRKKPLPEILEDMCTCACEKQFNIILPWTAAIISKMNWTGALAHNLSVLQIMIMTKFQDR